MQTLIPILTYQNETSEEELYVCGVVVMVIVCMDRNHALQPIVTDKKFENVPKVHPTEFFGLGKAADSHHMCISPGSKISLKTKIMFLKFMPRCPFHLLKFLKHWF